MLIKKQVTDYNLDKIKFGIDSRTWERAVDLYQKNKVKNFKDNGFTLTARVYGTQPYRVVVSKKRYTDGDCTCYLGQNDTLCKHMIAVAIYGIKKGKLLTKQEAVQNNELKFSGKIGELSKEKLSLVKAEISGAIQYIKAYDGPSKTWFAYQDNLTEGCNRLSSILSKLPADKQTADLVVKTLLRLDKKLTNGGVDDSNGTVGGCIEEGVNLLKEFIKKEPTCKKSLTELENIETCFGWEEELIALT